jgi:hypothetical protein
MPTNETVRTHTLELMQYHIQSVVSASELSDLNMEILTRGMAHDMVTMMRLHIYGTKAPDEVHTFRYPTTWLDAARAHFAGRWWMRATEWLMRRRWKAPATTEVTLRFSGALVFPDIPVERTGRRYTIYETPRFTTEGPLWET